MVRGTRETRIQHLFRAALSTDLWGGYLLS